MERVHAETVAKGAANDVGCYVHASVGC
jgi:hypothetical protein